MNQRGQVFSLDLIMGMVLVLLAAGFLLVLAEQSFAAQTAQLETDHLFLVASTASELLVTHPDLTCDLMGGSTKLAEVPNCLPASASPTAAQLGIPDEYDFCLTGITGSLKSCATTGPASSIQQVASLDRHVVLLSGTGTISKSNYYGCQNDSPSCPLNEQTVTIQVWRIP